MRGSYYNEIDPYCAEWLRNLMMLDVIAPGEVDTRSIEDVRPDDLKGFAQCHFFAGIGVWSYALRRAGWPDDRAVWTGSCPCQPFSAAGKGAGFTDERHLWPAWFHLIEQCRPATIFGEQVASKDGLTWLDLVQSDLEGANYSNAAFDLCAAGVGAPHIRQRLYFVADTARRGGQWAGKCARGISEHSDSGKLGDAIGARAGRNGGSLLGAETALDSARRVDGCEPDASGRAGAARDLGDAYDARSQGRGQCRNGADELPAGSAGMARELADNGGDGRQRKSHSFGPLSEGAPERSQNPANAERRRLSDSFWSSCDWLPCIDGKARPVEPGTFPLAHGVANRVGRLRAYGNAIVGPLAEELIRAYLDVR